MDGQTMNGAAAGVTPCMACAYVTAARRDGRGLEYYAAGLEASADLMTLQPFRRLVWAERVAMYYRLLAASIGQDTARPAGAVVQVTL